MTERRSPPLPGLLAGSALALLAACVPVPGAPAPSAVTGTRPAPAASPAPPEASRGPDAASSPEPTSPPSSSGGGGSPATPAPALEAGVTVLLPNTTEPVTASAAPL